MFKSVCRQTHHLYVLFENYDIAAVTRCHLFVWKCLLRKKKKKIDKTINRGMCSANVFFSLQFSKFLYRYLPIPTIRDGEREKCRLRWFATQFPAVSVHSISSWRYSSFVEYHTGPSGDVVQGKLREPRADVTSAIHQDRVAIIARSG